MLYLLVVRQDEELSFSLWTTEQAAKSERKYLCQEHGISVYACDIVPIELQS